MNYFTDWSRGIYLNDKEQERFSEEKDPEDPEDSKMGAGGTRR